MASVLSASSIRAIERGIRAGKCLTVVPSRGGTAKVVESDQFLSPEESEALLNSIAQPSPGDWLDRFVWEFASGSTKDFAAKVGYHPNRISALKSSRRGITMRLFRQMVATYKLSQQERDFWGKRLLGV